MDDQSQEQHLGEEPNQSQEQPTQDSGLQTPQPDQPTPPEVERQAPATTSDSQIGQAPADAAVQQDESAGEAPTKPRYDHPEQSGPVTSGASQDPVQRETELEAQRREHNQRTGGGEILENEVQDARQEHNDRTGGGQVPGTSESVNPPADEA